MRPISAAVHLLLGQYQETVAKYVTACNLILGGGQEIFRSHHVPTGICGKVPYNQTNP